MKLLRVGPPGAERPIALGHDGTAYDLSGRARDIDGAFLAGLDPAALARDAAAGLLPVADIAGQRVGAPVTRPGKVVGIGLNYRDHAAEAGAAIPDEPVIFLKPSNTVVGPYDEVLVPRGGEKTDYEAELAIVIGRTARYLASTTGRRRRRSRATRSPTTSPSGPSSWSAAASGTRASRRRPSRRSAPGWSPRTRSPTRSGCGCASGSTAGCGRTAPPPR